MNYRDYKQFGAGEYAHVYTRGNDKMPIFRDEQDYRNFLKRLRIVLGRQPPVMSKVPFDTPFEARQRIRLTPFKKDDFSLIAYCLMPNHVHFCIRQNTNIPISSLMLRVSTSYAKFFNRKYSHVGHIFQDQFSAVRVESDRQLIALTAYIHNNPRIAGLVSDPREWLYSSYREHIAGSDDICEIEHVRINFKNAIEYERFVARQFHDIRERKNMQIENFDFD